MCWFGAFKTRKITEDEFRILHLTNPDGIGVAYPVDGEWAYFKTLSPNEAWRKVKLLEPPYYIHFRLRSAGTVRPEFVHPFPITLEEAPIEGRAKSLIFHLGSFNFAPYLNELRKMGIISPDKIGYVSDSYILSKVLAVWGTDMLDKLNWRQGWHTRVILLTSPHQEKYFGHFTNENGNIFSDSLSYTRSFYSQAYCYYDELDDWDIPIRTTNRKYVNKIDKSFMLEFLQNLSEYPDILEEPKKIVRKILKEMNVRASPEVFEKLKNIVENYFEGRYSLISEYYI